MKGLPDLRHLTHQQTLDLAGTGVLVLIAIIVAIILIRRLRRRDTAPTMDDQPIDLSQRLGKLIEGISPEPAPPTQSAATDSSGAGDMSPSPLTTAPQTAVLASGDATGMLGAGTGMLKDGTGMLGAAANPALLASPSGVGTRAPDAPVFMSAAALRLQESTGVARGTVLSLPGAQVFDYRALRSLWQPLTVEEAPQTASLAPRPDPTSWNTAILPNRAGDADGWDAPEPLPESAAADAGTRDLMPARGAPQEGGDAWDSGVVAPSAAGAGAEGSDGWETGALREPAIAASWDQPAAPQDHAATGWDEGEGWDIPSQEAETAAQAPSTPWAAGTGSLRLLPPDESANEDHEVVPHDEQIDEGDWTHRLAMFGAGEELPPAAVAPTGQLGAGSREEEEPAEDTAAHAPATGWDSSHSDLENLSSFPITEMPPADQMALRTRGAPPAPAEEDDGWEPVVWPSDEGSAPAPQTGALGYQTIVTAPSIDVAETAVSAPTSPPAPEPAPLPVPEPAPATVEAPARPAASAPPDLALKAGDVAALEGLLAAVAALPDGRQAALVRRDGSPIAGSLQGKGDARRPDGADPQALLAATLAASGRCSSFANLGTFDALTLVGRAGMLLVMETGPLALLAVVTEKDARLGPLRRSLRRHVDGIKEYLGSRYVS